MRRLVLLSLSLPVLVLTSGCQRTAQCATVDDCIAVETSGESSDESTTEDPGEGADDEGWGDPQIPVSKDIDILFVIDNSGSMGEEQAKLAANASAFINILEANDVEANYRIGITTTDNGNIWCPAGTTTPEGGKLVLSSCKTRLGDFLFGQDVDVQDIACNDICSLSAAELEILPTVTDYDDQPKSRPWLERIEGKQNIPSATSMAAAFECFLPQGINGCGFESTLESMYLSLVRAELADEASYGFLRPNANLAIVILSDEADCSANKDYSAIFDADGNKAFWSDPSASFPTSAVCWNAGVECVGDPSGYDDCTPVNKGVNGSSGVADSDAVLHPLSRYVGLLEGIEQQKQELAYEREIIVALIGGVDSDGFAFYADAGASDPVFQDSFGIGPGCTAPNPLDPGSPGKAVPPVRMRDVVDAFTPGNLHSICEDDYSGALAEIAKSITAQIAPACSPECVADTDPSTEIVDPECTVTLFTTNDQAPVLECLRDGNGYVLVPGSNDYAMPNADTNLCYAMLVDPGGLSTDPGDDMSPQCIEGNYNLEFKLARRPGFPLPGDSHAEASCELAPTPDVSCPGIGG